MRVFVVGASGAIGRRPVPQLIKAPLRGGLAPIGIRERRIRAAWVEGAQRELP